MKLKPKIGLLNTFQRDLNPAFAMRGGGGGLGGGCRAASAKKAVLTTWMTLQSIPEETIITPVILAFLEQVSYLFLVGVGRIVTF